MSADEGGGMMASCWDCIHFEDCSTATKLYYTDKPVEERCICFKDRSQFVELPCKVGDTIYWDILGKPVEDKITNITIYENVIRVFLKKGISFDIEEIGRTLFLSREAAEQALKECENNENQ